MKFLNIIKPTSSKAHKPMSDWGSEFPLENMKNKSLSPARSNSDRASSRVTMSNWDNDIDDDSNREIRRRRLQRIFGWFRENPNFVRGFLLGCLGSGLILAAVTILWTTSSKTSNEILSTGTSTTTTSATTTTTTSVTSTSTTSATTSTTSTTTTSTTTSTTTTSTSTTSTTATTTSGTPTCVDWLWDTNGVTIAGVTGIPGSTSDKLNSPWNIYLDPTTNILYIADSGNQRIQKWLPGATSGTTVAGTTGNSGSSSTLLDTPYDVYVDSSGNMYVADSQNRRIQYFPNGSSTATTVSASWGGPPPGKLYAVQAYNRAIYACDFDRNYIWNNGSQIGSSLKKPQGFTIDTLVAPGTLYIANSGSHTIVKWVVNGTAGTIVAGVDSNSGSTATLLNTPTAVKIDNYTNIFVVDNNNHRVQLFCQYPIVNTTGRTIAGTGSPGQANNTLNFPVGIALDASLNLYVSDTSNHRIQKFRRLL